MFKTVAVGTDGSETAAKAVDVAIDIAGRYGAKLLIFSVYEPVNHVQIAHEQADAPDDIQWAINPTEYVDAALAAATERAAEHGLQTVAVARMGEPAR